MLSPHALELVQSALLASFWRKSALKRFLRRLRISDSALAHLDSQGTKREFIDWLFPKLERTAQGKALLRAMANELASQVTFNDLEGWEDSAEKKRQAKEAVNALRKWLDAEAEQKEEESLKRQRREAAEQQRASAASHTNSLQKLRSELDALAVRIGTQSAGYDFQNWFGSLCSLFELDYKKSYRSNGREIDGSITVGDMTFLLSLKFENKPTAPSDIDELKGRLHRVADYTMGILLSMAGFGETAKATASGAGASVLLIDHNHLYYVLSGACSLGELIARIRRHASRTGEAYLDVQNFGR